MGGFLERGVLGICTSPVCTKNVRPSTTFAILVHVSLWASKAGGTARYAIRLVCTTVPSVIKNSINRSVQT